MSLIDEEELNKGPPSYRKNGYYYQKRKFEKFRIGAQRILDNHSYVLTREDRDFLEWAVKEPYGRIDRNIVPVLNKVFGENPKAGDKATLQEIFDATLKGKKDIDRLLKYWREKLGIVIEYHENTETPVESFYEIVEII
jgi:hypothetical protein